MKNENLQVTTDLFKKHFDDVYAVNTNHPNFEKYFHDLNLECLKEDKLKIGVYLQPKTE